MRKHSLASIAIAITMTVPFMAMAGQSIEVVTARSNENNQSRTAKTVTNGSDQAIDHPLDAQGEIAQAAEHFDAFALLMPSVLNDRLEAFMKHGFKAILLPDNETRPNEERMIDSLVKGLQALGHSLAEDLQKNNREAGQSKKQAGNQK